MQSEKSLNRVESDELAEMGVYNLKGDKGKAKRILEKRRRYREKSRGYWGTLMGNNAGGEYNGRNEGSIRKNEGDLGKTTGVALTLIS